MEGSYKNLDDILKYKNDHWHIAKVISKNSNLIELSIINSDEIINLIKIIICMDLKKFHQIII